MTATREANQRERVTPAINLRIKPDLRELIDRACEAIGTNRTEFLLQAARIQAEQTLLDQTRFVLNDADWDALMLRLENPQPPTPHLRAALNEAHRWKNSKRTKQEAGS